MQFWQKTSAGEMKGKLSGLTKSNLFETLRQERVNKNLSIHMPKSPPKHPLVLLLSSQKDGENNLLPD